MISPELGLEYPDNPELQAERELELLLRVSPEVQEEVRPQLWGCLDKALAVTAEPLKRSMLETSTEICDWMLFGTSEDPLPKGLVVAVDDKHRESLARDSRLSCWSDAPLQNMGKSLSMLRKYGFDDITERLKKDLESRDEEINAKFIELLETTKEFTFIQAFDTPPIQELADQPLSSFQKIVRETQAEHAIRKTFGLEPQERIEPHSFAGKSLARIKMHIDEETEQNPQEIPSTEGVERARAYLLPFITSEFAKKFPSDKLQKIAFDKDYVGSTALFWLTADGSREKDGTFIIDEEVTGSIMQQFGTQAGWQTYAGKEFLKEFIERVFDKRSEQSLSEIIDEAKTQWLENTRRSIFESVLYTSDRESHAPEYIIGGVRKPRGERVRKEYLDSITAMLEGNSYFYQGSDSARGFRQRADFERDASIIIGEVVEAPQGGIPYGRIIQFQPLEKPISGYYQAGMLCIRMGAYLPNIAPDIPGMELVYKRNDEYGYLPDKNGDEYAPCTVAVPHEKLPKLLEAYAAIGLENLADELSNSKNLTVEALVELIKEYSTYHIPEGFKFDGTDGPYTNYLEMSGLEDFKKLISEGRLITQCTLSDAFLGASLSTLFGPSCVGSTQGYVVADTINRIRHRQTIFTHDGRLYILDATPPSPRVTGMLQNMHAMPIGRFAPIPTKSGRRAVDPNLEKSTPNDVSDEVRYQLKLKAGLRTLEQQLVATFGVHDTNALYEKMAQLPAEDPIRRVLEVTIDAVNNRTNVEALTAVDTYLTTYKEADVELVSKTGLTPYPAVMLDNVGHCLDTILWTMNDHKYARQAATSSQQ